jgi:phage gp36-like protein
MYLTPTELTTHIYPEIADEISREDDSIIEKAISEAIQEAKSYLSRFDLMKIFGNDATEPIVEDENLKSKVKDIAVWRLVRLANPNISMALARTNYEDAIRWMKDVQKGTADPEGWPYKPTDQTTPLTEGAAIGWGSNTKRRNHF